MSLDLSTLALKETFALQLKHPTEGFLLFADKEDEKPVIINLYGKSSKQYQKAVTAMQSRALRRQAKKTEATPEMLQSEALALLEACSASAENLVLDGKPIVTSADLRVLYENPKFSWVKDQTDEALGETANFLPQ
jgi:hypothetical protein